jgi:hypothetical protein
MAHTGVPHVAERPSVPQVHALKVASSLPLNDKVLAYAQSEMGIQVGNGECWTLVDQALASAGAQRPGTGGLGLYEFGNAEAVSAVVPGDVLQFENIKFVAPNGAWMTFPHHTAIVGEVHGTQIVLLEQNVNNDRHVQRGTIDLADLQAGGTLNAFRPRS